MAELTNFIELVENNNLLFELEETNFYEDRGTIKFLTIQNFIEGTFNDNVKSKLKYDLSELLGKNIDDRDAIIALSKHLDNNKIEEEILEYKHRLIVKLAEKLKEAYDSSNLEVFDGCLVYVLSTNSLYKAELGIFTEIVTGKKYEYRGSHRMAFHNVLSWPDTMLVIENEIFLNLNFINMYFNKYYIENEADLKKHGFFNSNRFTQVNSRPLPIWRLKLSSFFGYDIGCVPNFSSEYYDVYKFLIQNNGYYFNLENIIKKVKEDVSQLNKGKGISI